MIRWGIIIILVALILAAAVSARNEIKVTTVDSDSATIAALQTQVAGGTTPTPDTDSATIAALQTQVAQKDDVKPTNTPAPTKEAEETTVPSDPEPTIASSSFPNTEEGWISYVSDSLGDEVGTICSSTEHIADGFGAVCIIIWEDGWKIPASTLVRDPNTGDTVSRGTVDAGTYTIYPACSKRARLDFDPC